VRPLHHGARGRAAHFCRTLQLCRRDGRWRASGIWTAQDALAWNRDAEELDRSIGAVMSAPLLTLDASTSLREAAVRFKQSGIRHFGVVHDGKCIGVLTQTDVVVNQGTEFFLRLKPIEAIHLQPLVVVAAHRPLRDASALMRAHRAGQADLCSGTVPSAL
jgi:CBS domain-containing protein